MKKITFEDKIPIQVDGTIARKNKITADDINEIKDVINTNAELMQANISKAETLQEDISNIKDEQKKQNEDIENNKAINEENSNSINAVLNAMPTAKGEGEQVTLENTIDFKFKKFKIKGNSKQETRSGKNILNSFSNNSAGYSYTNNGVTFTLLEDGKIKVNGTATGGKATYFFINKDITLKTDNYMLSQGSESIQVEVKIDNTYQRVAGYTRAISLVQDSTLHYAALIVNEGKTIDNEIVYAQLEKGTTATEYEQYGQTPSAEFPIQIKNVEENVRINIRNKNFCDLDILEKIKGRGITINSSNSFTINLADGGMGVATGINIMLPDGIDKSKKYRIKYHRKMNNTSFLPYLKVLYVDGNIDGVNDRNLEADYEYVTNGKELSVITLAWNTQSQGGIVTFSNISITEINENSDFEESKKQLIIFPLAENQKLMKDDYLAEDGIHHKRKQIVLDGTENWFIGTELTNTCSFGLVVDNKTNGAGLCNSFITKDTGISSIDEEFVQTNNSNKIIYIRINKERLTSKDVQGLKTFLSSQKEAGTPVVVEYELAEEEVETYTEEQQKAYEQIKNAKSYDGQTNIYCDNETSAIIEAEAYANINSIINNLQAQIISNASEGV